MLLLQILGLVGALALGLWIGRPRPFDQAPEEIEELLSKPGDHRKATRHVTFLNLLQRKTERGSERRRRVQGKRPFQY